MGEQFDRNEYEKTSTKDLSLQTAQKRVSGKRRESQIDRQLKEAMGK